MKILLVEDDIAHSEYLSKGLSEIGHCVDCAHDGEDATLIGLSQSYDVIILDRMLPKRDGMAVLKILRAGNVSTPVIILSAMDQVRHRIEGLRGGADDYLIKPFAFSELVARVEALSRRASPSPPQQNLEVEDLQLDLLTKKVTRSGREIELQSKELHLLEYLMRHSGQIVTKRMLLEQVWEIDFMPSSSVVETQICRLRAKIDRDFKHPLLRTIRGLGYRLG